MIYGDGLSAGLSGSGDPLRRGRPPYYERVTVTDGWRSEGWWPSLDRQRRGSTLFERRAADGVSDGFLGHLEDLHADVALVA